MAPTDLADPLRVFKLLAAARVPFVIIGGHAVTFHGYVRTTEDADLIFERTPASEAALLRVLNGIHASWISNEIDPQTKLERLVPVSLAYLQSEHLPMNLLGLSSVPIRRSARVGELLGLAGHEAAWSTAYG